MKKPFLCLKKMDYSWVIVVLCFAIVFTTLGLCSSGRTLYLNAITDALGFSRGEFSLNDTMRFVTTTIVNLFFGVLVKRFGTKKLICAGFLCLIGFALINSVATELWAFYLAGILLGVGLSWTSTTMVSTIINKWCKKKKATITGAVLAANGIGGAIAVQILSPIIYQEGNPFGYQSSYRLVALLLSIVFVLVLIVYRDPKEDSCQNVETSAVKKRLNEEECSGMEFVEIIRKPYFYVSLVCVFLIGMVLQGLSGIAVPHMYDIGLEIDFVALTVSLGGLLLSGTKFLTGYIYDKWGIRTSINLAMVCAFVSMLLLYILNNSSVGVFFAIVRTVTNAFAMPLETVMLPIIVMEFFGMKAFDRLIGIVVSVSAAGFSLGSPLGNLCFDIFGDYKIAILIFAILMAIVAVAFQYILSCSKRDKENYEIRNS